MTNGLKILAKSQIVSVKILYVGMHHIDYISQVSSSPWAPVIIRSVSQLPTNIGSPYLVDTLTMLDVHIHAYVTFI